MLFFGLELMSAGMKPLRSLESFQELTVSMSDNPILGIVVGTVFTLIVQSSSATIGILQELFGQGQSIYKQLFLYYSVITSVQQLQLY